MEKPFCCLGLRFVYYPKKLWKSNFALLLLRLAFKQGQFPHTFTANSPIGHPPIARKEARRGVWTRIRGRRKQWRRKTKNEEEEETSSFFLPHPVFLPPLGWMGLCILSSFLPPIALRPAPKMKNGFSWGTPAAAGIAGSQGRSGGRGEEEKKEEEEQCPQPTR
jgi:hypothetical protein